MRRPLLAVLAVVPVVVLGGCNGRRDRMVETTIRWTGPIGDAAQLALRTRNGAVTIDTIAGDSVELVLDVRRPSRRPLPTLDVLQDGAGGLLACVKVDTDDRCVADAYDRERSTERVSVAITVRLPAGRRVDVASTNGDITLVGRTTGAVLDTRNGTIRAQDVAGALRARTSNGALRVQRIVGPVELTTSNGSIRFIADTVAGDVSMTTSNGGITAWLPPTTAARLAMTTSNGSVALELPGEITTKSRTVLEGVLGAGTHAITMASSNASLAVKPRSAARPFAMRGGDDD